MVKSVEWVAEAWKQNRPAFERTVHTDGKDLYSFGLKIGFTKLNGAKVVMDYTRDGGSFVSHTTSVHVGEAKKVADEIISVSRPVARRV